MTYAVSRPGSYVSPISLSDGLEEYGEPDEAEEARIQAEINAELDVLRGVERDYRSLIDERAAYDIDAREAMDYDIEADRRERADQPAYDDSGLPF